MHFSNSLDVYKSIYDHLFSISKVYFKPDVHQLFYQAHALTIKYNAFKLVKVQDWYILTKHFTYKSVFVISFLQTCTHDYVNIQTVTQFNINRK